MAKAKENQVRRAFYRDADAAYTYLLDVKRKDPQTILSFGQSLGTAVAANLAARHKVGGVLLEAPWCIRNSIRKPDSSKSARPYSSCIALKIRFCHSVSGKRFTMPLVPLRLF